MFTPILEFFHSNTGQILIKFLFYSAFVWVPVFLVMAFVEMLTTYRRAKFIASQSNILLEVRLPKEITKSPLAMELFFNAIYNPSGDDWWKGSTRPWFSMEIVSIDGGIHFFIWTRKGFKNIIESTLYSQYPGIEVYEVPDYTTSVIYDPKTIGLWATEFDLTKADPYPIKTYVDYGLDENPKEEHKIDPMTPLVEFLGSLGRGHQVWIQIIVRGHTAEFKNPDTGKMEDQKWAKAAQTEIDNIIKKTKGEKDAEGKEKPGRQLTKGEQDIIAALERSISKPGFDVGIRALYTAPTDIFSQGNVGGITGGFRNFNSNNLNGFKPARSPAMPKKAWHKWIPGKVDREKKKYEKSLAHMLDVYKRRAYFYNEFKKPYFVLNTEELATIYHFPGGVLTTPTFTRIGSKKAEAPANLPI